MTGIFIFALLLLGAFFVHALVTESVWARGNNPFQKWFYKIHKRENPMQYWVGIAFMALVIAVLLWALLSGKTTGM